MSREQAREKKKVDLEYLPRVSQSYGSETVRESQRGHYFSGKERHWDFIQAVAGRGGLSGRAIWRPAQLLSCLFPSQQKKKFFAAQNGTGPKYCPAVSGVLEMVREVSC